MKRKLFIIDTCLLLGLVFLVAGIRMSRGAIPAIQIDDRKVRGEHDAKVFILVFSDFQCPYCGIIRPALQEALEAYPHDLKIVFKHFPLSIHPGANMAALATECAADQGKFWDYHDHLFDHVREWSIPKESGALKDVLADFAGQIGMDQAVFRSCLDSNAKQEIIDKDKKEARHLFVSGTPTCILNARKILVNPTSEDIKRAVQIELERVGRL